MKKKLTIDLDEKFYQQLLKNFQGDENALKEHVAKILENQTLDSEGKSESDEIKKGLEDYLNKGNTGTRSYGIKGQGW
jgi:macrodomain Ter protein organizer (MatP/YcbG family)